jgi:hypothetical protein
MTAARTLGLSFDLPYPAKGVIYIGFDGYVGMIGKSMIELVAGAG